MTFTSNSEKIQLQVLEQLLHAFLTHEQPRRQKLYDYYDGTMGVNKGRVASGRPNNSLTANFARYISDVQTGYFMGVAPAYEFSDSTLSVAMLDTIANSNLNHSLFAAARDMSICGEGFILTYIGKHGASTCRLNPLETFVICNDSVGQDIIAAVRVRRRGEQCYIGELYTKGRLCHFSYNGEKAILGTPEEQVLKKMPISRMCNNMDCTGDFESVLSLLDAYNLLLSGAMDDMQSVANAFLALYGMQGTRQEDIDKANISRVLSLSEGGRAEFVVKNLNPDAISLLKRTLIDDMLLITMTPNLNDDSFGSAVSGISLEYKLWGIEQSRSAKEGGFSPGLYHTLGLLWEAMALFGTSVCDFTKVRFYKNLPRDLSRICEDIKKLEGIVSQKTLLSLLPFIEDADKEIKKLQEEQK